MDKELLLNDLNCILINSPKNIEVEINGVKHTMSSDDVFNKVNFNAIEDIIVNEEDSSYIKFANGEELVILHGSEHLDSILIKSSTSILEYEKFLEEHGEKLAKEYEKVME